MSKAVAASLPPPTPSNQMTIAAPMASRMASTASTSAPASVDSAGTIYLGVKGYRLPAIYDITTDPIDPPRFDAIARLRPRDANPITYAGLYAAELQHAAYSDIEPDLTDSTPQEAYDAAMKVIIKRKWRIVDARPPQGSALRPVDARAPPGPAPRDGFIEAIARTPILGFRDDVVVRVRPTSDIDDVLARPQKPAPAPAPAKPQAPAKGAPAKR